MRDLKDDVANVPDFPQPGILFRDIAPLLRNRFDDTIRAMDALFGAAPRHHAQEPASRRFVSEICDFGLGHGSGAHAPDEYFVIDSTNPKVQGFDGAVMSYVEYLYELAK